MLACLCVYGNSSFLPISCCLWKVPSDDSSRHFNLLGSAVKSAGWNIRLRFENGSHNITVWGGRLRKRFCNKIPRRKNNFPFMDYLSPILPAENVALKISDWVPATHSNENFKKKTPCRAFPSTFELSTELMRCPLWRCLKSRIVIFFAWLSSVCESAVQHRKNRQTWDILSA